MSQHQKLEWITPERARDVLENFNPTNRKRSEQWVNTLATYMDCGKFHLTHQGIAFNCDGTLKDGQHRLAAIVRYGKPVQMWVAYNVPNEAMDWIDTHRLRSDNDNLAIHGSLLSNRYVAIAKAMRYDYKSFKKLDRDVFRKFATQHADAINFSISLGAVPPLRLAQIGAVIARAWYSVDRERLSVFGRVLSDGIMTSDRDRAAIVFRNFMLKTPPGYGASANIETYQKCQSALQHFLDGSSITKIYGTEDVLFRIPGDPE